MNQEQTEKYTSEQLFAEMWGNLSHNQRRFCIAMLDSSTKKEAAEIIGLEPTTVYHWNGDVDKIVEIMRSDIELSALGIIQNVANKAAYIKSDGLNSDDEKIRQGVASEILDRVMGKPTQRSEVSGPDGGPLLQPITYITENRGDE